MSVMKTGITVDLSALVDGTDNDAADVLNPLLELRTHIREGHTAVSAADTYVKTLGEALVGEGIMQTDITDAGGDETLGLSVDDAQLVTPDNARALANKTLVAPIIASFLNAQHDHSGPVQGGQLDASTVFGTGTVPMAQLPVMDTGQAGLAPGPDSSDSDNVLKGDGTWGDPDAGGVGTVTSVGLALPDMFDVAHSPLVQDGVFGVTKAVQASHLVLASPDGNSGTPTFRALVKDDLPALAVGDLTDGAMSTIVPWTQLGTATSVISLGSIPGTYSALLLMVVGRSTVAANTSNFYLRFNGDTGSNYRYVVGSQYFVPGTADETGTEAFGGGMPGATATANRFAATSIWLHGYAVTGRPRIMFSRNGSFTNAGALIMRTNASLWTNTANVINTITLIQPSGNFAAGTSYALFGLM